jgi:hypothetical protein
MAVSVDSRMPPTAPFQPACAAPTRAHGVGEKHRAAIGRADADGYARAAVTRASAFRAVAGSPDLVDDDRVGAVHLVRGDQPRRLDAEEAGGAGAVFQHRLARVLRAGAGVQPLVESRSKRRRGG